MHPMAFPGNRSGAFDLSAGDRVYCTLNGKRGVADEFLQDGEAYVSWDDGSYDTVKWNHLIKEPPPKPNRPLDDGDYEQYYEGV